jgi:putative hemolysin
LDFIFLGELVIFVILMGFSGFFSSTEVAMFSLSRTQIEQMRKDGHPRAGLIERLVGEPRRLIVTILIGNEFVNVTASVISAAMIIHLVGAENSYVNLFVMVPILLLFGEITPKVLAMRNNVKFAIWESIPIDTFARLITPLRWVIRQVSEFFISMVVGKERSRGNIITEDMVRTIAREAVGEGALDNTEAQFIDHIFDFGNKTLEDVRTPRADVHFIAIKATLVEVLETVRSARQSRFPVYEKHRDKVLGILHARDLLKLDLSAPSALQGGLRNVLRPAYFVPESKPASEQFEDFRKHKRSFALTVDEYGGVTGVVTMEDLLECIFGEIPSPSDAVEEARITRLDDQRWSVDGGMPLDDFAQAMGTRFEDVGVETVGGLVFHEIGELPAEATAIDIGELRFIVAAVEGNRITRLIVEHIVHLPADPAGAEPEAAEADKEYEPDETAQTERREER